MKKIPLIYLHKSRNETVIERDQNIAILFCLLNFITKYKNVKFCSNFNGIKYKIPKQFTCASLNILMTTFEDLLHKKIHFIKKESQKYDGKSRYYCKKYLAILKCSEAFSKRKYILLTQLTNLL